MIGHFLGKEAGKAISSLIGSALKVPDAYFSSLASTITSDAEAKAQIKALLAEEVGRRVITDEGLLQRTAERWFGDQVKAQLNREGVAAAAVDELEHEPAKEDRPVDEDFLGRFNSYAEKATSEDMRRLFGRVLAGEIRTPGTFSLLTLHTLSIMDRQIAQAVETSAPWLLGDFFPGEGSFAEGSKFDALSLLEGAGLIYGVSSRARTITISEGNVIAMPFRKAEGAPALVINTNTQKITLTVTPVTPVGAQIFALTVPTWSTDTAREVADALLKTSGVVSVGHATTSIAGGNARVASVGEFNPPVRLE